MYRTIITLIIATAAGLPAFSQNDSIMNIRATGSELRIEAAGFGITLGNGKQPVTSAERYAEHHRPKRVTTSLGIASLDFGFNSFAGITYTGRWADRGDFLDLNSWKSIRLAWEPASVRVALDRKANVLVSAGLRLTADNYSLANPYTLSTDSEGHLMPEKLEGMIKKSKLTATYIGIPLRLTFRIGRDLRLSAMAAGEVLVNSHTKYKKPKVKNHLSGMNDFRFSTGGSLTYDQIGLYVEYAVSPMFRAGTGADANTLSIGLRFGI